MSFILVLAALVVWTIPYGHSKFVVSYWFSVTASKLCSLGALGPIRSDLFPSGGGGETRNSTLKQNRCQMTSGERLGDIWYINTYHLNINTVSRNIYFQEAIFS